MESSFPSGAGNVEARRGLPYGAPALRFLLLCAAIAAAAFPASAELEVSPVIVEVSVRTESAASGSWTVRNRSMRPATAAVSAISYTDYSSGRRDAPAPSWLKLAPPSLTLAPGEESRVAWTILLPRGASGESLALAFFEEKSRSPGTTMIGRIGTAVYALASGTARPAGFVREVRLQEDAKGGEFLLIEIANTGNVHFRPTGTIEIRSAAAAVEATAVLVSGGSALPGTGTIFRTTAFPPLSEGRHVLAWKITTGVFDSAPGPALDGDTVLDCRRSR